MLLNKLNVERLLIDREDIYMRNKRENKGILILIVIILVVAGICNYANANANDIEPPTTPLNLQWTLNVDQIDLEQNRNKNGKYENYNKWVDSLRIKLQGYNDKPKLKLYWEPSNDNVKVEGYKVFRSGIEVATTELPVYIDDNFVETDTYDYSVIAFDSAMNMSKPSNTSGFGRDITPPSVTQLTVDTLNDSSVRLSWTESTDDKGVKEYIVFRNGIEITRVNVLTYDDILLSSMTNYVYSVKSVDLSGNTSDCSNETNISVVGIDSGLTFIKKNSGAVLSWNKISSYSSYNLYRKASVNGTFSRIAQPASNTYTESSLTAGTTYYYEIGYINDAGLEIISATVNVYYSAGTNVNGSISGNCIWTSTSSPYTVQGSLNIPYGSSLKIMPGTIIKFTRGVSTTIGGKFEANGTSQYPIIFTSDKDPSYGGSGVQAYNSWGMINVGYYGEFTGDYLKIKYGGNTSFASNGMIYVQGKFALTNSEVCDYYRTAINLDNSGPVIIKKNTIISSSLTDAISIADGSNTCLIENNTISNSSKSYGIYIRRYLTNLPNRLSIKNNSIYTGRYPIAISLTGVSGQLSTVTDGILENTFYKPSNAIGLTGKLSSNLMVPKGVFMVEAGTWINNSGTLTLSPGTVLRLTGHDNFMVYGKVNALGTAQEPIVLTTEKDSDYGGKGISSDWDYFGIKIENDGEFTGEYTKIKYGGNYQNDLNYKSSIYTKGKLSLINSEISNSYGCGIYYYGGQILLLMNTFTNNSKYAIYGHGGTVDASYNSWQGSSGPGITINSTYNTIYTPWLGEQYDIQLHFGEDDSKFAGGNFSRTYSDMTMDIPGFNLNFGRTYNSRDNRTLTTLGRGWFFSLEGNVKDYGSSGAKMVRLPDGTVQTFNANGNNYTSNDSRNQLIKQADGTFVLNTKDQYKYGFNSNDYLVWMKDRNDNMVTISVDNNGKVTSIIDAAGRKTNISYNLQGMISTITDPIGRIVKYDYTNNRLSKVTDATGKVINYNYDTYGFLCEIRDSGQNLVESVAYNHQADEERDKITQTTDASGNVFVYKYDNQNRTSTATDSKGRKTITWYDILGYPIKVQDYEGRLILTEYYKEAKGMNKFGEEKFVTDRCGNITQYIRDSRGNITKIINPDSSFKEFEFDEKNNKILEKDESGKYTFYIFDANKINLVKRAQPLNGTDQYSNTADQTRFAITQFNYYTDEENLQFGYIEKGLLKNEIDPEGGITSYTYDSTGNIKTVTDSEGKESSNIYNQIGWKVSTTSPSGYTTIFSYDNAGRLEKTVLNNGETTRIVYDIEGRKVKEISPNLYNPDLDDAASHTYNSECGFRYAYYSNGKVKNVTDPENNISNYTYDLYGNVINETKPNGGVYQYEYDVMNRLSKIWFKENVLSTLILLESYTYTILVDGKTRKSQRRYLNSQQSADTTYTYDFAMRLLEQINPDGGVQKISYNSNGTIDSTTDANGNTTYYTYDGLNRQITKYTPFEVVDGDVKYTYSTTNYDLTGRKKGETEFKDGVSLNQVPTSNFKITNYDYYKNGKLKSTYDNSGRRKDFLYDDDSNLIKENGFTDAVHANITEYLNNYLGKPDQKIVHVRKGDIFGNDFASNEDLALSTSYTYDKNGNLKTLTRPDGIVTVYEYDNLNRQTKVIEPGQDEYGKSVEIIKITAYNWEDKPVSIIDVNGNTTNYLYNQRGQLEKIVDAKNGVTAYYYDTAGRKISLVSPRDYDSSKTLEQMNRTQYSYDISDRLISKRNIYFDLQTNEWITINNKIYSYDNNGNILSETDALGNSTSYFYNFANKQVLTLDPVSADRGLSFTTNHKYDALGRKISDTNAVGVVTSYYLDNADNLMKITVRKAMISPEIVVQSRAYDLLGNVLDKTDANGNTLTYKYNALGKVRSTVSVGDSSISAETITYQYDVLGNLKSQHDILGTVDLFTYDNQGKKLSHTQQRDDGTDSITTSVKYDKNENKRFVIDGNGNIKEDTFDKLNRVKTTTVTVSGKTQTTILTYDANGNQLETTDWRGNTYTNIYDALNRIIERKGPDNNTIQKLEYNANNIQIKSYDALENMTEYTHDKNNRLLSTIDPELHIISQAYDDIGNIKTKKDGKDNITTFNYDEYNRLTSVINANNETTNYAYDQNGNMLTQTDAKGNIVTFKYNVRNKLMDRSDDSSVHESYTYFADGNLKTKIDRNEKSTNYIYDSHGRLISESVGNIFISYAYDGNGNRLRMVDSTGTTTQTFDELNRTKTRNSPNIGKNSYVYDIISDIQDGYIAQSSTDPKGNTVVKVFDKEGRLKEVISDGQSTVYEYYDNGRKKSIVYPNGLKEEYTYYKDGLLDTLLNKKTDSTKYDSYSYTYDDAHNQTSKNDNIGVESYTYDSLNRLESVTEQSGRVTTYTFDASGNRDSEAIMENNSTTVTSYTYNEQNRLLKTQTKFDGAITSEKSYTYDNNGNQLSESEGDKYVVNTYDDMNQLVSVATNNATVVNTYNGDGIRVVKIAGDKTTRYLYEGNNVILELDSAGTQRARNIQGTSLISRQVDDQTAFYFYNGHGDITALIDLSGKTLATYYYDVFGNLIEENGTIDNPFRFSGYQYDSETNNYYLMSRMYDPETARFLQEDSYRGDKNDPLSLNLYTYCHNEPVMYWDYDGHDPVNALGLLDAIKEDQYKSASIKAFRNHLGLETREQKAYRKEANRYRDKVKQSFECKKYPEFREKVDEIFNKDSYSSDGNTYEQINELINVLNRVQGNIKVLHKSNNKGNNSSLNLVYYNQADSKWGSKKYSVFNDDRWKTANGGKPQDIGGTGCGPTSMAMVISSLTGQEVTPTITAEDAIKGKYRTEYNGTSGRFFVEEAKNYNLQVRSTNDIKEVKTALSDQKHLVIASMGQGHFTGGGHYIVLSGVVNEESGDKLIIMDPNMNNGRYKKYNDGVIELTNSKGIVKANYTTVAKETNGVGYFIYSR